MKAYYPSLYQINTRVWLQELSKDLGRPATLDDIPDEALDRIARAGFDWVWFLGLWQTGDAGRSISAGHPQWRQEFLELLPDLKDEDICGSPFAIQSYTLHADFGGAKSLSRLRRRLRKRDLRLLLDFVPNHTALDHPWVHEHPEFYIHGTEEDRNRDPGNYYRLETSNGVRVLAHGRDPYFPAWPDTLQLNYRHPGLREAMIAELGRIAGLCDGVRCDMAMLILPDVFEKTWGQASRAGDGFEPTDSSFWPEAIGRIRQEHPEFLFMAEVYWDREWALQKEGFDYTYDKRLYDRLLAMDGPGVRGHLRADMEFQARSVRFLENHDEPRAASAFPPGVHAAAACVSFLIPGMRFLHEGQIKGRRARAFMHLQRRPQEATDPALMDFYLRLLECMRRPEVRNGQWRLLESVPAWEGNNTWERFITCVWQGDDQQRLIVAVNYGPTRGQCYVPLPLEGLRGKTFLLRDLMSREWYERNGDDLASSGLYLDMPEWGTHVFEFQDL